MMSKKKKIDVFVEVIEVEKEIDCEVGIKYYNGLLKIIVKKVNCCGDCYND